MLRFVLILRIFKYLILILLIEDCYWLLFIYYRAIRIAWNSWFARFRSEPLLIFQSVIQWFLYRALLLRSVIRYFWSFLQAKPLCCWAQLSTIQCTSLLPHISPLNYPLFLHYSCFWHLNEKLGVQCLNWSCECHFLRLQFDLEFSFFQFFLHFPIFMLLLSLEVAKELIFSLILLDFQICFDFVGSVKWVLLFSCSNQKLLVTIICFINYYGWVDVSINWSAPCILHLSQHTILYYLQIQYS